MADSKHIGLAEGAGLDTGGAHAADLTLPGDIPGLLRRGSPVMHQTPSIAAGGNDFMRTVEATIGILRDGFTCVQFIEAIGFEEIPIAEDHVGVEHLALDLTDATGRAHAAWSTWETLGIGEGAPRPSCGLDWLWCGDVWSLGASNPGAPGEVMFAHFGAPGSDADHIVPALAHLDPDDPRTLPDGSRWVDAEALRLVVLHVAGRMGGEERIGHAGRS